MIKFRAQGRKRVLFGFGITDKNIELLKKGHPIKVRMEDLGCKGLDITIFYGPSDDTMKKLVEDQTGITLNPVKETPNEQRKRKSPLN
jgi:hypothetical protein